MSDPRAVNDTVGEWLELYNAGNNDVNLRGWTLTDLGSDRHTIDQDVVIQPGQYLVLARSGDTASNGGVIASYTYAGLSLANSADELMLFAPDGSEVDRVVWGMEGGVAVQSGASTARVGVHVDAPWAISTAPWTGSTGDLGSPGFAYQLPFPTATGTVLAPTSTPTGDLWPRATGPSPLLIDEVSYSGSDDEFVVLINGSDQPLDLTGWAIGDEEAPGAGEGFYALPEAHLLAPSGRFIIAREGATFRQLWGRPADAEFGTEDPLTPNLMRRRELASGEWALNNSGDEIVLLNPNGEVADVVVYGSGLYHALGVQGELRPPSGYTLQRVPDARYPTVTDQRHRFLYAPPAPFASITIPTVAGQTTATLADDLFAVWGSLGAQSTFSADGAVPPHYLLAAAGAEGLDFLAIADPTYVQPWWTPPSVTTLPAWRWTDGDEHEAVVYSTQSQGTTDVGALLAYLHTTNAFAQWQAATAPLDAAIPALNADTLTVPDSLTGLVKRWRAIGAPLLPAGNSNPSLPSAVYTAPRYTGLAVSAKDSGAIQEALVHRRGWLTNHPGLALAMRILAIDGQSEWMGTTIGSQNAVTVQITYSDRDGDLAALALWQDNQPLRQLDLPAGNSTWTLTIPALPDTFLYAVATQADGDFALTAPVYVLPANDGRVLLNEALPAPWGDHNGDGEVNTDDEFVELYNPSDSPLSLAGWQLIDAAADAGHGRAVTLKAKHVINAHSWLALFRNETYLSLNNENESIRLLNSDGEEMDRIAWATNPGQGASLGRLPDGESWQKNSPTPGEANLIFSEDRIAPYPTRPGNNPPTQPSGPSNEEDDDDDDDDLPPPVQLDPSHGQAGGPPASVAQSKLAGLEAEVEFYGVVIAPPGLFNAAIYVADPAPDPQQGPLAGIGVQVYLPRAGYPELAEGDRVRVRGTLKSFRGEMELQLADAAAIWRMGSGTPLQPLPIAAHEVGESLEGRLVTFRGVVSGWQGDSIYLSDPVNPKAEAIRVTIRSSTGWRRPYVNRGELWEVTGIVSQFAWEAPWNGGYRVLVRYKEDLAEVK